VNRGQGSWPFTYERLQQELAVYALALQMM
jgi:hypothetical protein